MLEVLIDFSVPQSLLAFRDNTALGIHLTSLDDTRVAEVGASRGGQTIFGVEFGHGSQHVSIIAGSHADEPIGPMTAQALPLLLADHFPELLDRFTFHLVPQMNPDGADRNRPWFSSPLDLDAYLRHATRELPGDDIEFGFAQADDTRPECLAAMGFLRTGAPYAAHFSLHGMAFAEGAWCLLTPEWVDRAEPMMSRLEALYARLDVPMHDVERNGEKGFTRIRKGFCTTPNSVAMKQFFLDRDDPKMATRFKPSSMEWIRSLGGDPLCMVSELPLFLVGKRSPHLDQPIAAPLKDALTKVRALNRDERTARLDQVRAEFRLSAMPIDLQVRIQTAMVVLALEQAQPGPMN